MDVAFTTENARNTKKINRAISHQKLPKARWKDDVRKKAL